ncbi:mechanosensitive ion channel family protein [Consotaella salsifontis]|uniref:Mechanosensitive ion channel n=1 Tax=Consotaella salsifontis TaxID=1365950 RepID=A0A1T4QXV8_9HYPH|nr:mechanosensitive ion channel family protein [Consotaella salsifontis]SKA08590.1 Mechanosensitive ion channel [Consotaella salsifontis]
MFSTINEAVQRNLALSLAMVIAVFFLRAGIEWLATRRRDPVDQRRRAFAIRTAANALLAVCLLSLWMDQIQSVMLSLTAVMVALVVATKELIMCIAGSALRIGGHLFKVGDRIEVNGLHGEVIDHGLFSTTVMELPSASHGHCGTGRTLMLPNSVFLTSAVRVEAQPRQFAPHSFTVTLEQPVRAAEALKHMKAVADAALAADLDRATRFHRLTAAKHGTEIMGPGAEVSLSTTDFGKLQVHVMLYCLVQDARQLEQQVVVDFLTAVEEHVLPSAANQDVDWETIGRHLRRAAQAAAA